MSINTMNIVTTILNINTSAINFKINTFFQSLTPLFSAKSKISKATVTIKKSTLWAKIMWVHVWVLANFYFYLVCYHKVFSSFSSIFMGNSIVIRMHGGKIAPCCHFCVIFFKHNSNFNSVWWRYQNIWDASWSITSSSNISWWSLHVTTSFRYVRNVCLN